MITKLDIAGNLIESLRGDGLTRRQLLAYCAENAQILKSKGAQQIAGHLQLWKVLLIGQKVPNPISLFHLLFFR